MDNPPFVFSTFRHLVYIGLSKKRDGLSSALNAPFAVFTGIGTAISVLIPVISVLMPRSGKALVGLAFPDLCTFRPLAITLIPKF